MIGYSIMAVAVCGLAISRPLEIANRVIHFDSAISGLIYILMNPIYYALAMLLGPSYPAFVGMLGGLSALLISTTIALLICGTLPGRVFFTNWDMRLVGAAPLEALDTPIDPDEPMIPVDHGFVDPEDM